MELISQAFLSNKITLNEARIGLGLPPDFLFGHKYAHELFHSPSLAVKSLDANEYMEELMKIQLEAEESFKQALKQFFRELKKEVLDEMMQQKSIEPDRFKKLRKSVTNKIYYSKKKLEKLFLDELWNPTFDQLENVKGKLEVWGMPNPSNSSEGWMKELEKIAAQFAQDATERYRQEASELFDQAKQEKWNETKLRDEMRGLFNRLEKRAAMIATSETVRATNLASEYVFKQNGVKEKIWHAEKDACPFCKQLDGQVVNVGEAFVKKGEEIQAVDDGKVQVMKVTYTDILVPPAHPHCRCSILPVLETEAEEEITDPKAAFQKRVKERIQQGLSSIEDFIELGRIFLEEKDRRMKKTILTETVLEGNKPVKRNISMMEMEEKLRRAYEVIDRRIPSTSSERIEARLYEGYHAKDFLLSRVELHHELLSEIRPLGFPEGMKPTIEKVTVNGTPIENILSGVTSTDPKPFLDILEKIHGFFPRDWLIEAFVEPIGFFMQNGDHAGYVAWKDIQTVGGNVAYFVMGTKAENSRHYLVHEMGHRFEEFVSDLYKWTKAYRDQRTKGKTIEPLDAIGVRQGWKRGSFKGEGLDGNFVNPYIGRVYPESEGTEILTTALEYFFGSMKKGALYECDLRKDPEHEAFIWGLLAGL